MCLVDHVQNLDEKIPVFYMKEEGEIVLLSTGAFLQAMIPLYIMSLIGFTSRKMKILNSHANQVITNLMLYITLPALILFSLNISFSMELFSDFIWLFSMSLFILSMFVLIGAWMRAKRSEEHTSELQSRGHLVFRLLL